MEEKPRAPRAPKRVPVQFGRVKSTSPDTIGQTVNLSARGLALVGEEVFAAGTVLKIVLNPTDLPPFELKGTVVWSAQSTGQMGVKLLTQDDKYVEYVNRLLARKDRSSLPPMKSPVVTYQAAGSPSIPARKPGESLGPMRSPLPPTQHASDGSPIHIRPPGDSLGPMRSPLLTPQSPMTRTPGSSMPPMQSPFHSSPSMGRARGTSVPPMQSPLRPTIPPASSPSPTRQPGDSMIPMQSPFASIADGASGERASTGEMPVMGTGERISTSEMASLRMARFNEPLPARMGHAEPLDIRGFLVNISRSGVLVQSGQPFDRGSFVRVTVTTADGQAARMEGEVMWSRLPEGETGDSSVGLRITRANKAFRQLIDDTERHHVGTFPA